MITTDNRHENRKFCTMCFHMSFSKQTHKKFTYNYFKYISFTVYNYNSLYFYMRFFYNFQDSQTIGKHT